MIKDMYKVTKFGKEWHVDVYETTEIETRRVRVYVLGRNDGAGLRHYKTFVTERNPYAERVLLPKRFGDAMLAWVTMRGET